MIQKVNRTFCKIEIIFTDKAINMPAILALDPCALILLKLFNKKVKILRFIWITEFNDFIKENIDYSGALECSQ